MQCARGTQFRITPQNDIGSMMDRIDRPTAVAVLLSRHRWPLGSVELPNARVMSQDLSWPSGNVGGATMTLGVQGRVAEAPIFALGNPA
jgi:hypothetical protein